MSKKILLLIAVCSIATSIHGQASEYYFAQQLNGTCAMIPIINFIILNSAKKQGYDFSQFPSYNRAQWFGITHPSEITFFKLFYDLNYWHSSFTEDEKVLKKYLDEYIENGPVLPNFYDKDGIFSFGGLLKGPRELIKFMSLPFGLIDFDSLQSMKFKTMLNLWDIGKQLNSELQEQVLVDLPVFQEKGDDQKNILRIFNEKTARYEPQPMDSYIVKESILGLDKSDPSTLFRLLDTYPIFEIYTKYGTYLLLGGRYQPQEFTKSYAPYAQGIYKIMLLVLGLNHNNELLAIDGQPTMQIDTYGEREAIIALQSLCNADPYHPWNKSYFQKEDFLPYAVTEILKKNEQLTNQLKQTVDFAFEGWYQYAKLIQGGYYNKNKKQMTLKSVGKFIPGEHQILAFLLLQSVRLLWYGSHNPQAFYFGHIPHIPLIWSFDQFRKEATQSKNIKDGIQKKASFLESWELIRDELIHYHGRRNWISFDGHGWVVSFDPKVIKLERAFSDKFYDDNLNKRLGLSGIESSITSELFLFYKIKPAKKEALQEK